MNPIHKHSAKTKKKEWVRDNVYMTGTLAEISGQKLSTKLLRLDKAWSLSKGWASFSMARSPQAELTIVAIAAPAKTA